jgi:hypothetical protein
MYHLSGESLEIYLLVLPKQSGKQIANENVNRGIDISSIRRMR